jgi:1,4-dihydroxy-6-naphthoate synthase
MDQTITIYHSPDADDAFMFYGLTSGAIQYPGFQFKHALSDIESLNQRTRRGELDVTAVSVHAYAYLASDYLIMTSGASMGGKDYGPRIIAKEGATLPKSNIGKIAIPGELTSATLALQLFMREKGLTGTLVNMNFEKVQNAIKSGEVDFGVIIHEGQITHQREGLTTVADLGKWWWERTSGLPLPLGVNVIRRSLGAAAIKAASTVLHGTIEYSLNHRDEALDYALSYGRGISKKEADVFVGMYVNERTLDIGEDGRRSIARFLTEGAQHGFIPEVAPEFTL